VAGVIRCTRPRLLFAPYWVDAHPDHVAATQLVEAARFWSKLSKSDLAGEPIAPPRLLYYYCVHLRLVEPPSLVLDISAYWDRKREAIECYHSQFTAGREGVRPSFIDRLRDQAAYWGWSIGTLYGEPLASREPIGLTSLRDLLD
jgi:LmbE family N-acetylglucosaminyl deacetylase